MKRLAFAAVVLLSATAAFAGADQYGGFSRYADEGSLKPFARDLGGVLGAATFQSGRSLGLTGFDVGARFGGQFYPSKGNAILRNNGVRVFGLPWLQAEVGMPFKISGFIRGVSYQGLTIAGGGLRYGLYATSDKPWAPQVLISAVAHSVVHGDFSAAHAGANLICSAGTPFFAPYAGVGLDRMRLVVRHSTSNPLLNGRVVNTLESRFTLGMRLTPYQFTYLNLAATMAHGQPGAEAGLGVRF